MRSIGSMARILFFAFLAICVVQLASPAPRTGYGLTRTFFEDAAEAPTVSAVQATEVGILDGLGLIQVDLADAVSANQISVEDPALSVSDLTLEVQLNKEKTRVEADATMRSRDAALDGLWTVLEASANGDLDAAKEASKFALRASLDASQDAEEVVSAAVAASAEIAKTAEQRVQATMVDAVERAQMALEIASEIDITYGTQGESTETSEAAIEVTKIANEVFDEIMEKAVADAQRIQQEAAAEMKALKAVGKQAKEAADEALDAAKKAAEAVEKTVEEEVKLAVQLGTDEDFLTAVLAANDADKEINFELVATSAVRDEVDTAIQDGLDAIDGLETLSDIIIDDYIFKAEIAKETTDDQIEVAIAIAANEEADGTDAETNADRNVGIVLDESDNVFTILPYSLDHETNVEDPGLAEFALDYEDEGTMNILPFNYYMGDEQFEVRDPILPVDLSIDGNVEKDQEHTMTILPVDLNLDANVEKDQEHTMTILPVDLNLDANVEKDQEHTMTILPVDLNLDANVEKGQEHTMTILPVDLNLDANVEKDQEHTMTILPVDLNLDANAQKDQEHTMTILPVDLNLDANVEKDQEHTMTILPVDLNLGANVVAQETEVTPNLLSDILAVADGNGQQPAVDTDLVNIDLGVSNNIPATEEIPAEHTDAEITIDVYYDDIPDSQADTEQEEGSVQVPVVDVHEIAQENPSNDITSVTVDSSDNADTPVAAQDAVNEITPEVTVAEADHEDPSVDTASVAVELSVNADTSANADESDAEIKASVENVEQTQESVNIPVVAVHEVSQEKPSTDTASVTVDSSVNADIPVATQDAVNEITPEVAVSGADHEEPSVDTASVAVKLSVDTDTSAGESDAEIKTAVENAEQTQESVNIPVVAVHEVSQENPSTGTASVTVNLGVDTVGDALANSGTEITTGVTPDVAVDAEPKQASGSVDDATSELVADVSDTTGSDAAPIVVSISGGNQSTDQDSTMSADDATAVLADTLGAAIKHLVRDDSTLVL